MIVSSLATPFVGDAPGNPAAAPARDGAFGEAVKTAGQERERKASARDDIGEDLDPAEERVDGGTERSAEGDDEAAVTAGEIVGRLLGGSFASPSSASAQVVPAGDGENGQGSDGELEERIVISTVADLAGSSAEPAAADRRVALRVTRMETHFEPRLDAATLVEAGGEPLAADDGPGAGKAAIRPAFGEILQRLGATLNPSAEGEGESVGEGDGKPRERLSASRKSDKSMQSSADVQMDARKAAAASQPEAGAKPNAIGVLVSAQIAERIVDAFASSASGEAPAASRPADGQLLRMAAGGAALKTLSIQLEPQDLGRVEVSMRLVDGRLSVELAASVSSTAEALAGDRVGLRRILEHAGFALDDAAITIVARDPNQTAAAPAAPASEGGRQQSSAESGSGGFREERRPGDRAPSDDSGRPAGGREERERPVRADRASGSIYL